MSGLSSLIERLEEATAGSEEFDCLIRHVVYGTPLRNCGSGGRYTRSLDGALTLVNEIEWVIQRYRDGRAEATVYADATKKKRHDYQKSFCGVSATAALALCIAALKARSQG